MFGYNPNVINGENRILSGIINNAMLDKIQPKRRKNYGKYQFSIRSLCDCKWDNQS